VFGGILGALLAGTVVSTENIRYEGQQVVQQPIMISYDALTDRIPDSKGSIVKLISPSDEKQERSPLYGVSLSSDGWAAFAGSVPKNTADLLIIDSKNNASKVVKVAQDPAFNIWYAKSDSTASKPVNFLDPSKLTDNFAGVLVYGFQTIQPLLVTGNGYPDDAALSDIKPSTISKRHNFEQRFPTDKQDLPVFSTDGVFVGFTASQGIIPGAFIRNILPSLFRSGAALRTNLPIRYKDLSWVTYHEEKQGSIRGAQLEGKKSVSYPLSATDGNVMRLHGGDIIKSVNKESIDANRSLSDIIQQYAAGSTITLSVDQGGELFDYTFTLSANE